jgi:uncharacterized protein
MSLKERISSDIKTALKNADSFRVGVLRLLASAFQNEAIAKRSKGEGDELADDELVAILKREAKKRKESIDIYSKANRPELAENEERELKIIREYLPPEPTKEDIRIVVKKIIDAGEKEFSFVMKSAMAELKGADGKAVSEVVREILG